MRSTKAARFIKGIVLGCVITNQKVPSPSGQRSETSFEDRSLLGHGKRKRSQASPHDKALCANQTDASFAIRFLTALQERASPYRRAICSSRFKRQSSEQPGGLSVLYSVGNDSEGKRLNEVNGGVSRVTISHDSWQVLDLRDPATIFFLFRF